MWLHDSSLSKDGHGVDDELHNVWWEMKVYIVLEEWGNGWQLRRRVCSSREKAEELRKRLAEEEGEIDVEKWYPIEEWEVE